MSSPPSRASATSSGPGVIGALSMLDRFLPVWIVAAMAAGLLLGRSVLGRTWYESRFLPLVGPLALYGLLFPIVILFALQGGTITSRPGYVARIALPLSRSCGVAASARV